MRLVPVYVDPVIEAWENALSLLGHAGIPLSLTPRVQRRDMKHAPTKTGRSGKIFEMCVENISMQVGN